ncbi:hypothetical protein ENBRE01_1532 [Enteropsectra breve]|nr:hypothetical protein ENBRE01_1532 [Enteropsectra breve]
MLSPGRKKFLLSMIDEELVLLMLKKRSTLYDETWYKMSLKEYDNSQFEATYRMPRLCMTFIEEIFFSRSLLVKSDENLKYFHMLVYFSMYSISYRALGEKFGVTITKTFYHLRRIKTIFNRVIGPIYIKRPQGTDEYIELASKFSTNRGLIGTILAVDGTHIPIEAPKHHATQYINRKGWYSIVFQLVADADYIIRDIFGGFPGCCHDAYIYARSPFKNYVDTVIPSPYFVIGDSAYPSSDKLATPFRGILTLDQEIYTNQLSSQRMHIECTIGRIKGRFKRFMTSSKNGENAPAVGLFYFACVLHNIITLHKLDSADKYYEEYLNEQENDNND